MVPRTLTPACSLPRSSAFVLPKGSLLGPPPHRQAALGPSQWREGSTLLEKLGSRSDQDPVVKVASLKARLP